MERYTKLVRDKIPEILDRKQVPYEKRIATPEEYRTALAAKLMEEAAEFSADESVEELADVLEVIEALKALPEFTDIERVRRAKRDERGGFGARIILTGEK